MTGKKASATTCSVECNLARLAERRKAAKWAGVDPERPCQQCGERNMQSKRPHASFCSRACKVAASDIRRRDSGASRIRDRARYAAEAEKRKAYARKYLAEHPEEARATRIQRKLRIGASKFRFTTRDWERLLARHGHRCAYCGVADPGLQREHVVPIARGGSHGAGNILPACAACNYAKKDKLLVEWRYNRPAGSGGR